MIELKRRNMVGSTGNPDYIYKIVGVTKKGVRLKAFKNDRTLATRPPIPYFLPMVRAAELLFDLPSVLKVEI